MNKIKNFIKSLKIYKNNNNDTLEINDIPIKKPLNNNENVKQLCYTNQYIILKDVLVVSLPDEPIPFFKIKIINLGKNNVKIITLDNIKIYNNFYCPNGSEGMIIEKYKSIEIFFVNDNYGNKLWMSQ